MLKRLAGAVLILAGLGLGAFVIYAAFVSDDPDVKIRRPGKAIGLAVGITLFGFYCLRGTPSENTASETMEPPADEQV